MAKKTKKKKPGPKPEKLAIEGNWKEAVKKVLEKERPQDGWPKPGKKKVAGKPRP